MPKTGSKLENQLLKLQLAKDCAGPSTDKKKNKTQKQMVQQQAGTAPPSDLQQTPPHGQPQQQGPPGGVPMGCYQPALMYQTLLGPYPLPPLWLQTGGGMYRRGRDNMGGRGTRRDGNKGGMQGACFLCGQLGHWTRGCPTQFNQHLPATMGRGSATHQAPNPNMAPHSNKGWNNWCWWTLGQLTLHTWGRYVNTCPYIPFSGISQHLQFTKPLNWGPRTDVGPFFHLCPWLTCTFVWQGHVV